MRSARFRAILGEVTGEAIGVIGLLLLVVSIVRVSRKVVSLTTLDDEARLLESLWWCLSEFLLVE